MAAANLFSKSKFSFYVSLAAFSLLSFLEQNTYFLSVFQRIDFLLASLLKIDVRTLSFAVPGVVGVLPQPYAGFTFNLLVYCVAPFLIIKIWGGNEISNLRLKFIYLYIVTASFLLFVISSMLGLNGIVYFIIAPLVFLAIYPIRAIAAYFLLAFKLIVVFFVSPRLTLISVPVGIVIVFCMAIWYMWNAGPPTKGPDM